MATKNKNIKTYDVNSVLSAFDEYMDLLLHEFEETKAVLSEEELKDSEIVKPKADIETFKTFLEENNLSTVHAEEIFNKNFKQTTLNDFKMRKMHPVRDFTIKKVSIPLTIAAVGVGVTIGAVAGSGLVDGAMYMGFIPASSTPGLTEAYAATAGATIGLVSTPTILKGKKLLTKAYYRLKAKSANRNLEDYKNGIDRENLAISKFVSKIQETQHAIFESKGPKNLVLKIVNRNRIHEVEAYTKQLMEKYVEIESNPDIDPEVKAETLKPIYELMTDIQKFISNDVVEARTHALLTCKSKKKDSHPAYMVENVDIYANLKIYIDKIRNINFEENNKTAQMKLAKQTTRNKNQKKLEASKIINGENIITNNVNFENKYSELFKGEKPEQLESPKSKFQPTPELDVTETNFTETKDGKKVVLTLSNGKTISIPEDQLNPSKRIVTAKEGSNSFSVTYADGSKQQIAKQAKVIPEVEAARKVLAKFLTDAKYVKSLKDNGYKAQTISTLNQKLVEWLNNPTQKLSLSGKVKTLYKEAIATIDADYKQEENAEVK